MLYLQRLIIKSPRQQKYLNVSRNIMKNYYQILEISQNADTNEIKKAYRRLSMIWHPDKNKDVNAHTKFIEINEAYEILIDPVKRIEYNNLLNRNEEAENSSKFKEWQYKAQEKAETYSKMKSEEFNSKILNELKLAGDYSVSFGCFFILIVAAIINLWAVTIIGPFALLSVILFGGGAIYLYNTAIKSYFEERKNL